MLDERCIYRRYALHRVLSRLLSWRSQVAVAEDMTMEKPAAWGDDEALAVLVREHYARVQRFGARACRDADAADDVVQEAFIKLASRPELLAHRGALSWLHTSVRRA
jgi:DNA-directed RNA polymerase specialized sigma24 family protein